MRTNLPVTTQEYPIDDTTLIVSRTDLKGRLTYFNGQFIDAAGFTPEELTGQPHNIIRHPDMPPEAFENLWDTLKAGKPWVGAVKNRRKNGDFYWVLATASAVRQAGEIVGYTSVRTNLPAEQRREAEKVYALLKEGKAKDYKIDAGIIRRKSPLDIFAFMSASIGARMTVIGVVASLFMCLIAAFGIYSVMDTTARTRSAHDIQAASIVQVQALIAEASQDKRQAGSASAGGADVIAKIAAVVGRESDAVKAAAAEADRDFIRTLVGLTMLLIVGAGMLLFVLAKTRRAITGPIAHLNHGMFNIAQGILNNRITVERDDEIGQALRNLQTVQAIVRSGQEELSASERRSAIERKAEMNKLAGTFEGAVGEIIETVSSASCELEASANVLTSTADRSQELATSVASSSSQASANVQSVASATEQMASSIQEISRQVQNSAEIAREAVAQAERTDQRIVELAEVATRIGDVVELINNIAGQTNLLALNATIEAARAGEAGRGFAVVASEVKALAEQTARATGEIGQQVTSIQSATKESVGAIRQISSTINRMSEISATIASAVEEQGAATLEISRNVQQASDGTQKVNASITEVQRGAAETGAASSQVLGAARSLSSESTRLKDEVAKFLQSVRVG
ncbi:MAG: PAS domain S-box protein [Bradyrhizobiaceae bacterium]|nr:MAG: PAS domain S-box protein [Bradyrhizobiaceae bacterium]